MSLRQAAGAIGIAGDFSWLTSVTGVRPTSLRSVIDACVAPRVSEWRDVGRTRRENRPFSEEINGIVTDGASWWASVNANDGREGVYRLSRDLVELARLAPPRDADAVHLGALTWRSGSLYVALQQAVWGVWVVADDLAQSDVLEATERPHDDMFAWCDVNPHNGLLYTSNFSDPPALNAYEMAPGGLQRRGDADIALRQPTDAPTTRVQSGCFTPNHKWLAVCDVDGEERIHVHSTLNGAFMGRRTLVADADETTSVLEGLGITKTRNELEGIWYHPMRIDGKHADVHVLELNNEEASADDFYIWHLALPGPGLL